METASKFLGQNPNRRKPEELRIPQATFNTDTTISFDLWIFKYQKGKQYVPSTLYQNGIMNLLEFKGIFKKADIDGSHIFVREEYNILHKISINDIKDLIRSYLNDLPDMIEFKVKGRKIKTPKATLVNIYLKEVNSVMNNNWLTNLPSHNKETIKDTKDTTFFFFKNQIIQITADKIYGIPYESLTDKAIWNSQIIPHEYFISDEERVKDSVFENFLKNVCNKDEDRLTSAYTLIGYMLNNHVSPGKEQACILYDETINTGETPNGGSGKGIIVQAIKIMRNTIKIDGHRLTPNNNFIWGRLTLDTQVIWIDETSQNFDFNSLFSNLTDGWTVERKFKDEFTISPENSPKVIICSNKIISCQGSSNARRQFVFELSPYYSNQIHNGTENPVEKEHGILFSNQWDKSEWLKFFDFMIECAQYYLTEGLLYQEPINVKKNLLIQKTNEEFVQFMECNLPDLNTLFGMGHLYVKFKNEHFPDDTLFNQRTFTNWFKFYCKVMSYNVKTKKSNGRLQYLISD